MNFVVFESFYILVALLLPISLIIGPAVADISIVILGLFYIIVCIKNNNYREFLNYYFITYIIFCAFLIFTSLISQNIFFSLESSLFYFRFGIFVLSFHYILCNYNYFSKYFFYSIILCFIILCVDSIFEFVLQENILSFFKDEYVKSYGRISSLFGDEYILGSYIIRLLPIACALSIINFKHKFKNIQLILIISISSLIIFISGERTALAMLLIFLFMIFMIFKKYQKLFIISVSIFFCLAIISLIGNSQLKDRILNNTPSQINLDIKNLNINFFSIQHEVVYQTSFKIIKDNFLFGIGTKMFREICKDEKYKTYTKLDGSIDGCQTHSHNTYIQILTETGFFGFLIFVTLYLYVLYSLLRKIFKPKTEYSDFEIIEIFCLLSFFINFWPFMPSGNFFNNWINVLYYLPIAFYLFAKTKKNK